MKRECEKRIQKLTTHATFHDNDLFALVSVDDGHAGDGAGR